jgi:hypothetical protein
VIFAELKSEKGKLMLGQKDWFELLEQCDIGVDVWRPSDLENVLVVLR